MPTTHGIGQHSRMNSNRQRRLLEGCRYEWVILSLLFLAQLVMSMGAYSWGPLAPVFRDTLGMSRTQIGQITSSLYIAAALIGLPSGIMVDRWGARRLLIACLLIMAISFFGLGFSGRITEILALAAFAGLGYGGLNQVSTKGIMLWFPAKDRATAMGIKQTGVTIGAAGASLILPITAVSYGMAESFTIIGALMIPVLIAVLFLYIETPHPQTPKTVQPALKRLKPDLKKELFKADMLTIMILLPFMTFNQLSTSTFLVLYLTEVVNTSIHVAGGCLAVVMAAGAMGRVGWGVISDRFFKGNRRKPLILLSLVGVTSIVCLASLPRGSASSICFMVSGVLGFSFLGWNGLAITWIAELATPSVAASLVGISSSVGFAGVILGPLVFGTLVDHFGYFAGWLLIGTISLACAFGLSYSGFRSSKGDGRR